MEKAKVKIFLDNGYSYVGTIIEVMPLTHKWISIQTINGKITINMDKVCSIIYGQNHPNEK